MWGDPATAAIMANPSCDGPVAYVNQSLVDADIANVRAAASGEDLHVRRVAGVIERSVPNRYYPTTEDYLFALADAMKQEYDAICQAGLVLQLDCPDLACEWAIGPEVTKAELPAAASAWKRSTTPPATSRRTACGCTCAGATTRARTIDVPLADIIDLCCAGPRRLLRGRQPPPRARVERVRGGRASPDKVPDPGRSRLVHQLHRASRARRPANLPLRAASSAATT